jgi:hypothetical protein
MGSIGERFQSDSTVGSIARVYALRSATVDTAQGGGHTDLNAFNYDKAGGQTEDHT